MIIQANRKRFPISFILGLIISVILILLIINRITHLSDEEYNSTFLIVSLFAISSWVAAYTILSFLDYAKTTFDKSAVLTITDQYVNDNLSIFSVGKINWTEITDIKIVTVLKTDFLVIGVTNPQLFIDRTKKFKQRPLKSFLKKFGSPVVVSQKRVDYSLSDLKEVLQKTKPK